AAALHQSAAGAFRRGGVFVGVLPAPPVAVTEGRTVRAVGVAPDGAALRDLLDRAVAGDLTPRVAGTVPLAEVASAFARVAAGGQRGRWVVRPS
ncbi:MAG: zinc-binding dehydrogenase, partial [Marmoricola sp.]